MITLPIGISRRLVYKCNLISSNIFQPTDLLPFKLSFKDYKTYLIGRDSNLNVCTIWGIKSVLYSISDPCDLIYQDGIHYSIQDCGQYYQVVKRFDVLRVRRYECSIVDKNLLPTFLERKKKFRTTTFDEFISYTNIVVTGIGNTPYDAVRKSITKWREKCQ